MSGQEQEKPLQESFQLKIGLNAVYMPELRREIPDNWGKRKRLSPDYTESTLQKLQSFLDEIDNQGGEVLGILPIKVNVEPDSVLINDQDLKEKTVFIIRKSK